MTEQKPSPPACPCAGCKTAEIHSHGFNVYYSPSELASTLAENERLRATVHKLRESIDAALTADSPENAAIALLRYHTVGWRD